MRSLKAGLLTFVTAGFFGMAAVIGCSADGAGDVIEDPNATEPTGDDGAQLPPSSSGSSSSSSSGSTTKDAGKDASKTDAGKDAGPPPPNPGDACTKIDQIFTKSCGMCGTQKAVCLADGADAGAGKVSDYSPCEGEKGVCVAGTVEDVACGNCGTAKRTCNQYCAWSTGACGGQPANSCTPGAVELQNAGCTVPDTYRQRSCQNNCTWENFGATCSPPPTFLLVPPTVGSVNSAQISLKSTQVGPRVTGSCPNATVATTNTPYNYFEVRNPTTKAATVSIYHSAATGGTAIDTIIAAYDGATPPSGDAAKKACTKGVGDFGTTALTGDSDFASLDGTKAVTIPAGGSVTVYSAAYYEYNAATPAESTGPMKINVKVESFQ